MARIDEIAPDLFRVSVYAPQFDLQFNHFLINDDEPLLFHTGMQRMFPEVRDAVAKVIDLDALRWIVPPPLISGRQLHPRTRYRSLVARCQV